MTESVLRDGLQALLAEPPSADLERRVLDALGAAAREARPARRGARAALPLAAAVGLPLLAVAGAAAAVHGVAVSLHGGGAPAVGSPAPVGHAGGGLAGTTARASGSPAAASPATGAASHATASPGGVTAGGAAPATAGATPAAAPGGGGSASPRPGNYAEVQVCESDDGATVTLHYWQQLLVSMYCTPGSSGGAVWSTPASDDTTVLPPDPYSSCAGPACVVFRADALGTAHVTSRAMCSGVCAGDGTFRITVVVVR